MLKRKKIDNNSKSGIMVGYIHPCGDVTAIEPGWNMTPLVMAKLLKDLYPSKENAIELVDSAVLVPVFRKDNYEYLDGFSGVLESNINFYEKNLRTHVGHLFCHMTGVWKYSNNGIDWDPISKVFIDGSGFKFTEMRQAVEAA